MSLNSFAECPVCKLFRHWNWIVLILAVRLFVEPTFTLAEPPAPEFVMEWGAAGDEPGQFHSPIGIALNSKDEVFVTDLNNARVQRFSTDGKYLAEFSVPLDAPERKSTILGGILIDATDLLYLSYMNQHKIAVYRESGELVREWGKKGTGPEELNQPGGMLLTSDGHLLIADQCNHRVLKHTLQGHFVSQWGGYGLERGQFDGVGSKGSRFGGPHFLARDSQERYYTTEGVQSRVQQFSRDGVWLAQWGTKGDQPGGFGSYQFGNLPHSFGPIGIVIDRHDRVFVSSLNDRVQCFDLKGKYLFGIEGTGRDQDTLLHPHGMAFDKHGFLYVCDSGNQRILKFKIAN